MPNHPPIEHEMRDASAAPAVAMGDDALAAYLRDVRGQRRLSIGEEQHLATQFAAGRAARQRLRDATLTADEQTALRETIAVAEAARQRLVETHLPLVVALARPYAKRNWSPIGWPRITFA